MPIHTVDEGQAMEPGHIYLAANGVRVNVEGNAVARTSDTAASPIDALFTSGAESYGEGPIAVVLSGIGQDGPSGLRAVKEHGGTVILEDPEGKAYPALSPSVPLNYIDFANNLESMPDLLFSLA